MFSNFGPFIYLSGFRCSVVIDNDKAPINIPMHLIKNERQLYSKSSIVLFIRTIYLCVWGCQPIAMQTIIYYHKRLLSFYIKLLPMYMTLQIVETITVRGKLPSPSLYHCMQAQHSTTTPGLASFCTLRFLPVSFNGF